MTSTEFLRITPSGEIYLKSRPTRQRFMAMLAANVRAATGELDATVRRSGHHEFRLDASDPEKAAPFVADVFGVGRVELVNPLPSLEFEQLCRTVADTVRDEVTGHTFAVRVKRRAETSWRSRDAEVLIGSLLLEDSAGVDLGSPEVTVKLHTGPEQTLLVRRAWRGVSGLPLGSQERALVLLSGGIDSPVAAWMMMRRGCPVDLVHLKMECSVADHALGVGHELISRWGSGGDSRMHVVDLQPIKDRLRSHVDVRFRQIALKQVMLEVADRMARAERIRMVVTGDSLGQVSSQTASHLVELAGASRTPVLRPLLAHTKEEIVARAREIGTYELSIRAREVCDLSDGGRVATAASASALRRSSAEISDHLVDAALASWESVEAHRWAPGLPLQAHNISEEAYLRRDR